MSFTDQKPFVVTQENITGFTRHKARFNCRLCGHEFIKGDTAKWVYANGTPGLCCGNFFVCDKCNHGDILKRAKTSFDKAIALAKQWDIYGPEWQS